MQLSIVIVNYNSQLLIEQCILSIKRASVNIEPEIIIVDNNSTDGSREVLPVKITNAKFIFNKENNGFAKACNQGYKISSGDYILFLNPDTILSENCLPECISFFDTHSDAGAAGVRMVDSKGRFLKESKRGFPSPAASFYKLFGLAGLFPQSAIFAKYYSGHLPEREINSVDILSGAFMMVRKEAWQKTGGFDESFFMYGEDIDLSCRIQQVGYKNYYLGTITVTHLKGGSTIRNAAQIKRFYEAMDIFIRKYYKGKESKLMMALLSAGIRVRKMVAFAGLMFR